MDGRPRTLRRLGISGLGAVIALAAPAAGFMGFTQNAAAAAGDSITIVSQTTNTASTLNDGTDSALKISAAVTSDPASLPSGDGIQFTVSPTTDNTLPTSTKTDFTAPYSETFTSTDTPAGTYTETAQVVNAASQNDGGADTVTPVVVAQQSSVHITSPAEGGTIGVSGRNTLNNGTFEQGFIAVSGTRSADLPPLSVSAETLNDADGTLSSPGAATTVAPPTSGSSQAWSATVAVPQCEDVGATNAQCDVIVVAKTTASGGNSDEATQATLYQQSLRTGSASFTISPASKTIAPNGTTPSSTKETITAVDQEGNPVAGLTVNLDSNHEGSFEFGTTAAAAEAEANGDAPPAGTDGGDMLQVTTGPDGTVSFFVADNTPETTTITATSDLAGPSGSPDFSDGDFSDVTATATVTTSTAQPTTLTFKVTPAKGVYASNTSGVDAEGGNGAEYTAGLTPDPNPEEATTPPPSGTGTPIPQVDICVADQNGNPIPNSATPPANLFVDITRTATDSVNNANENAKYSNSDPAFGGTTIHLVPDPVAANGNCYVVGHDGSDDGDGNGLNGNDAYQAYINNNGTAGDQSGSSDIEATNPQTLNFSELRISDDGPLLAQKGTNATGTFTVAGEDGLPFANRSISLSLPASGNTDNPNGAFFAPTGQPAQTTVANGNTPLTATCVTDANGKCSYVVTEPDNTNQFDDNVEVTATDNQTLPNGGTAPETQIATNQSDEEEVTFTNTSLTLTGLTLDDSFAVYPNDEYSCVAEPGAPMVVELELTNASGQDLPHTSVSLTTSQGYFTPIGADDSNYSDYTFTPAPADGEKVGTLDNSFGTTHTYTTDGNGDVEFALGMAKNAGFNDDGDVNDTITATANGGTRTISGLVDRFCTEDDGTVRMNVHDNVAPRDTVDTNFPTWSTDSDVTGQEPINPGAVAFLPFSSSDKLSGKVQEEQGQFGASDFDPNGSSFVVATTDQYGNLVSDGINPVQVTGTGSGVQFFDNAGEGDTDLAVHSNATSFEPENTASMFGVYTDTRTNPENAVDVTSNAPLIGGQNVTVTGTWQPPTYVFNASTTSPPEQGGPTTAVQYNVVEGPNAVLTTSFTINLYEIDFFHLHYKKAVTPHKVVKTGTTVHDSIRATDQNGQPVHGLLVIYHQSGPGSVDRTARFTSDSHGLASFGFSSSRQGNGTITVDVEEAASGVLLNETTDRVGFDGVPTFHVTPAHRAHAGRFRFSGNTRPGARVQLFVKSHGHYKVVKGAVRKAGSSGAYAVHRRIGATHRFRVRIDGLQHSISRVVRIGKG